MLRCFVSPGSGWLAVFTGIRLNKSTKRMEGLIEADLSGRKKLAFEFTLMVRSNRSLCIEEARRGARESYEEVN